MDDIYLNFKIIISTNKQKPKILIFVKKVFKLKKKKKGKERPRGKCKKVCEEVEMYGGKGNRVLAS